MHINDPEKIARRALEVAEGAPLTSDLVQDTRAGYGYRERALALGITSALCEMLRDMFMDGVELSKAEKASKAEKEAADLAEREADLERRELALQERMESFSGISPENASLELIAEATPAPTMNEGAAERAAVEEQLRKESIDSAALNAEAHAPEAGEPDAPASDTDAVLGDEIETGPGPHGEATGETVTETDGSQQQLEQLESMSYAELQELAESKGIGRADEHGKMKKKALLIAEIQSA